MIDDQSDLKKELRRELRSRRKNISDRHQKESQISHFILTLIQQEQYTIIGTYYPFDGEPSLLNLTNIPNLTWVYPKILPNHQLDWVIAQSWETDPIYPKCQSPIGQTIDISNIELLLIPLVGFDDLGYRLGMGGGYYDRCLVQDRVKAKKVGVGFECQRINVCPIESWDQKLDQVITEERVRYFDS
jgi:5-formyltetrahydrofolate cyclo-ligase